MRDRSQTNGSGGLAISLADHSDSQRIATRMQGATRKLHELAAAVGAAKQIREYDSDRRKNILAVEVVKALKAGKSVAAAEAMGRASEVYQLNLEALAKQYEDAEKCIAEWTAEQASFEAARSLLSFSKATMTEL